MKAHNEKKAKILYDYLDQSKLFKRALLFLRTDLV